MTVANASWKHISNVLKTAFILWVVFRFARQDSLYYPHMGLNLNIKLIFQLVGKALSVGFFPVLVPIGVSGNVLSFSVSIFFLSLPPSEVAFASELHPLVCPMKLVITSTLDVCLGLLANCLGPKANLGQNHLMHCVLFTKKREDLSCGLIHWTAKGSRNSFHPDKTTSLSGFSGLKDPCAPWAQTRSSAETLWVRCPPIT